MSEDEGHRLTEAQKRGRQQRNVAIGLVLIGLVVLFYIITIVKMAPGMSH